MTELLGFASADGIALLETTIAIPLAVDGDRRPLRVTVGGALAMGWRVVKKHVRVLQFPEAYFASHDEITAFEERLIACMPRTCEVDGHDIGSGTEGGLRLEITCRVGAGDQTLLSAYPRSRSGGRKPRGGSACASLAPARAPRIRITSTRKGL
jgi:hypothetical protein